MSAMRFVALVLIAIGASGVALAGGNPLPLSWPMYQAFPSHNAVFDKRGFRVTWVADLGGRINGGLAIVGDTVYADSFDHSLYAVWLENGAIRWRASTDSILMSTPVVMQDRVIVGSGHDGFLQNDDTAQIWGKVGGDDMMAFDVHDGRRLWAFHTVGEDMASPAIAAGRVIFANGDLHAYALNPKNGHVIWQRGLPGIDTMASAEYSNGAVFIGTCHNMPHFRETRAIDISTGRTLWRSANGSCDAAATIDWPLIFLDGNMEDGKGPYDPGGRDIVAAIDARTGKLLWRHVSPRGPYSIVASGEHAIAGTAAGGVYYQSIVNRDELVAFDERSGKILWRVATTAPVKMSPVITGERVIFGDIAGVLYSVARRTGRVLHTASFKDPFSTSPPVVVGDTVLIANGRYIFALPLNVI